VRPAVLVGMMFPRLFPVMGGVQGVAVGYVRVVRRRFMGPRLVMLRCFAMVSGGVLVMLRRFFMVFSAFVSHTLLSFSVCKSPLIIESVCDGAMNVRSIFRVG
jgi:hypothetical protein